MKAAEWTFEAGVRGVNCHSWSHRDPNLLIVSHDEPDTESGRENCDYAHCPRAYRDLPHFVLIDMTEETDKFRYNFEFEMVRRRAERIIRRSTP